MQTKHTFIFTLLLGLGWAGFLFAYQNGPDPGVNGIFGPGTACNQAGCHVGNPLNAAGGTLTLSGLPAQWAPGETYPLTVTIQRTGAALYGFQLSAVSDASNQQAGTLTKGKPSGNDNTRISIITGVGPAGPGVQYAEHNQFNSQFQPTTTFFVNWTAPASASFGPVRFNLAGNAANGNVQNTGDFIYTRVDTVAPGAAPAPDFSIAASPASATVTAGISAGFTVSVTGANGFAGNVALSVSGLPTGATASFSPPSVPAGAGSSLTVATATTVAAGTYPLTITGVSGNLTHSTGVSLTVNAAIPPVTVRDFSLVNLGGMSTITDGSGGLSIGYARIQPNAGSTTPAGIAIFGYRTNNVLVTETGVPASPLMTSGRIYAEVTSGSLPSVNTGLAIANPNGQTANINFFFTDASGTNVNPGSTTIPPNSQTAEFLNETIYKGPPNFFGTFSFTSDVPVSVVALRGLTNERGEFLLTTLPLVDTTAPAPTGTQYVPHFANGLGGWTTQVILVNSGSAPLTGTVRFFAKNGSPAVLGINGQSNSSAPYSIPARSSQRFVTSGPDATGSVQIVPTGGGAAPVALVVFTFKKQAFTVSEAGAPANHGSAFRLYVEASDVGSIDSGIAVANTSASPVDVTFELFNLAGAGLISKVVNVPASGQEAKFLGELFPTITKPFQGVLRISAPAEIAVVGLRGRTNERLDFLITTTPPTLESAPATSAEMLFPQLVNGGGYTTQFILFSGTAGQSSIGNLRFFKTDGSTFGLSLQ